MKVIICGSRLLEDEKWLYMLATAVEVSGLEITEIVSGCALGIDTWAIQLGLLWDIPVKEFPAKWKVLGKGAGYFRNNEMADYADAVIAVFKLSAECKGTRMMVKIAHKRKMPVVLVYVR